MCLQVTIKQTAFQSQGGQWITPIQIKIKMTNKYAINYCWSNLDSRLAGERQNLEHCRRVCEGEGRWTSLRSFLVLIFKTPRVLFGSDTGKSFPKRRGNCSIINTAGQVITRCRKTGTNLVWYYQLPGSLARFQIRDRPPRPLPSFQTLFPVKREREAQYIIPHSTLSLIIQITWFVYLVKETSPISPSNMTGEKLLKREERGPILSGRDIRYQRHPLAPKPLLLPDSLFLFLSFYLSLSPSLSCSCHTPSLSS